MKNTLIKSISITTLGCDKNRCDSESMAGILKAAGFAFAPSDGCAQIIIVNTCAFISAARQEALDTIASKLRYKVSGSAAGNAAGAKGTPAPGKCEMLIVTGCFPVRHRARLVKMFPAVDLFIGIDEYEKLPSLIADFYNAKSNKLRFDLARSTWAPVISPNNLLSTPSISTPPNKLLSTPPSHVFIKIADGCSNRCAYCTIPAIRGAYRSRPAAEILREAAHFAALGVPEFILVAQDVTCYACTKAENPETKDESENSYNLVSLLRELSKIEGVKKIRLHYVYPNGITEELITEIAENPKICKYIDIPLQHASGRVLRLMNRRGGAAEYLALIDKLRARVPGIVIRSTFMVGFPTETDADFAELCAFLRSARLDYVGFFAYSREAGTPAFRMPQVPAAVKRARLRAAGAIQTEILAAKNWALVGKTLKVVCDSVDPVLQSSITRTEGQSPDVDPVVAVTGQLSVSGYYDVKIVGVDGQNLIGEPCET
jgi:ribosomal protein S12 methylthiotransferase